MTLLLAAALLSAAAPAAAAPVSPLLGSWSVDVSRLPMRPEARPKRVTISFTDSGDGRWMTNVDIYGGDGSLRHMAGTSALDGTPGAITGDLSEADSVAVKLPAPNVMVMQLAKGGIPASTRVYTVAADGKTMIETAAYVGPDGKPLLRTNYFSRIK
jgi:hypothetical protein